MSYQAIKPTRSRPLDSARKELSFGKNLVRRCSRLGKPSHAHHFPPPRHPSLTPPTTRRPTPRLPGSDPEAEIKRRNMDMSWRNFPSTEVNQKTRGPRRGGKAGMDRQSRLPFFMFRSHPISRMLQVGNGRSRVRTVEKAAFKGPPASVKITHPPSIGKAQAVVYRLPPPARRWAATAYEPGVGGKDGFSSFAPGKE